MTAAYCECGRSVRVISFAPVLSFVTKNLSQNRVIGQCKMSENCRFETVIGGSCLGVYRHRPVVPDAFFPRAGGQELQKQKQKLQKRAKVGSRRVGKLPLFRSGSCPLSLRLT